MPGTVPCVQRARHRVRNHVAGSSAAAACSTEDRSSPPTLPVVSRPGGTRPLAAGVDHHPDPRHPGEGRISIGSSSLTYAARDGYVAVGDVHSSAKGDGTRLVDALVGLYPDAVLTNGSAFTSDGEPFFDRYLRLHPEVRGVLHFRDETEAYNGAEYVEAPPDMYPDDEW